MAKKRQVYSAWLKTYYQITPKGKEKSGFFRRFVSLLGFDALEVLNYLARYPTTPRSLQQIYEGINWQVGHNATLKAIAKLKRKGLIKRTK